MQSARMQQITSTEKLKNVMHTIAYNGSKSDFGIEGYKLPTHGLPPRNP
jgi:hypothetical protein